MVPTFPVVFSFGWLSSALPLYVVLLSVVTTISWIVYQRLLSPLARIPGPFFASVTRLWLIRRATEGKMNRVMLKLHAQHGDLVRISPNEVSVASLPAIKQIYGAGSKFRKSDWYSVAQGHRKFDLFAERDETIHAKQRRLVSNIYSMSGLKALEGYVDNTINVFMMKMKEMQGQSVDLGNWVQLFAVDVIGEITFSKRFGFMDTGDDGSLEAVKRAQRSLVWVGQVPTVFWINDLLSPFIGSWLALTARHGSLRQFAAKEVAARLERGGSEKDILNRLFATHKEKPEFDYNGVISMATSNIFAGTDTTAISTRAIIYNLLRNPECRRKLVEEIDHFRNQGKLSDPVRLEEASQMPYLQACMWEALRLHPVVGMNLPRVVPPGGTEINGVRFPAGTVVGVNPWVVQRNEDVYGEDADIFRPERWLERETGPMHQYFFAFGAGARLCIGKNISWMEMSKLIPTLFMRYDIQLVDPDKPLLEHCA